MTFSAKSPSTPFYHLFLPYPDVRAERTSRKGNQTFAGFGPPTFERTLLTAVPKGRIRNLKSI